MKGSRKNTYSLSVLAGVVGSMFFCSAPVVAQEDSVVFLDQGWTDEQRQYFYHQSQGTAMLPLQFYKNLEQADSEALISAPEFEALNGLIPVAANEEYNPDGLPIGLAKRSVEEGLYQGDWVGFTCSSCHNGEIQFEGQRLRIDGGSSNLFSMPNYGQVIGDAVKATLNDENKLNRLVERTNDELGMSTDEIKAELESIGMYVNYFNDRIALSPHNFGPGRMDALGQIRNTILGAYLEIPENVDVTIAPTKSPFLWNASQSAWVQWSGALHEPIYRNLGESLGAMTRVNLDPEAGEMFESTVDLGAQIQIERDLWDLAPPKWPVEILGEIDQDLAAKGKELAQANCSSCHTSSPYRWSNPRKEGKTFIENGLIPLDYIGTDDKQFVTTDIGARPVYIPGVLKNYLPDPYKGSITAPSGIIQNTLKYEVAAKYLPELDLSEHEQLALYNYADKDIQPPVGPHYKAAPLDGMWSVPPYLHNNSVSSIYELLLPASERAVKWQQGSEYDPKKIGLDTSGESGSFLIDTTLIGLSNAGHSFEDSPLGNGVVGPALSEEERWAIVEYMKTLPTEEGQAAPYGGPNNPTNAWEDGNFFNATNKSGYNPNGESGYGSDKTKSSDAGTETDSQSDAVSAAISAANSVEGLGVEIIEENEADSIKQIRDIVLQRMKDTYSDDQTTKRDAHPKTHGMVKAKLVIEKDLPDALRQGMFSEEKEFDALVRFSASSQIVVPDVVQQPQGMAIKVLGVEGPKLLEGYEDATTQDFVMINAPLFFLGDLPTYIKHFQAQVGGPEVFAQYVEENKDVVKNIGMMLAQGGDINNVFGVQYWSQTPYKYGPYTIKYAVKPLSGATNDRPDIVLPEYLRTTMEDTIGENEVRFEFVIQLQTDPEKQPLEDPSVIWQPSDTPEIRVATLIIPKQDISNKEDIDAAEGMSFAVWHTLEDHRPLGAVNRARQSIYKQGTILRRDENGVEKRTEPTSMSE